MDKVDEKLIAEVKRISANGKSAEVKWENSKGKYVIYEVNKKRTTVE